MYSTIMRTGGSVHPLVYTMHSIEQHHSGDTPSSSTAAITTMIHSTSVGYTSSVVSTSVVAIPLGLSYVLVTMMEGSIHPYDVLEAEPEIVSGYYVDYGGYVFMLIYLGEGVMILGTRCWCVSTT